MMARLGITYYVSEDNKRKSNGGTGVANPANIMKRIQQAVPWTRTAPKFMYPVIRAMYGKQVKPRMWPAWVVKTDEERVQNKVYSRLKDEKWIATEKLDGSSVTFTMRRKPLTAWDKIKKAFMVPIKPYEFYVCSRNVVFNTPEAPCFYDSNVYVKMAKEYGIEDDMASYLMFNPDVDWVTIQGEVYGEGIQKRDYGLKGQQCAAFNLIDSANGRYNSLEMQEILNDQFLIPAVPIVAVDMELPETSDKLLEMATGKSLIDNGPREGLVFRSLDGKRSFKAVSNSFLVKYHG